MARHGTEYDDFDPGQERLDDRGATSFDNHYRVRCRSPRRDAPMTTNDIAEAHDRAVSLVDFLAQRQGATTGRGASRAWENALAKAEELEYWTGRAKELDANHEPTPIYDDQGRREELKPESVWRGEKT
jgi:hypothetical protein